MAIFAAPECSGRDGEIAVRYLREVSEEDNVGRYLWGLTLAGGEARWGVVVDGAAAQELWRTVGRKEFTDCKVKNTKLVEAQVAFFHAKRRQAETDEEMTFWTCCLAERVKQNHPEDLLWQNLWTEVSRHPRATQLTQWESIFRSAPVKSRPSV
jgi:hypothetical protein